MSTPNDSNELTFVVSDAARALVELGEAIVARLTPILGVDDAWWETVAPGSPFTVADAVIAACMGHECEHCADHEEPHQ